jgi:hypothetical protein
LLLFALKRRGGGFAGLLVVLGRCMWFRRGRGVALLQLLGELLLVRFHGFFAGFEGLSMSFSGNLEGFLGLFPRFFVGDGVQVGGRWRGRDLGDFGEIGL